MSSCYTSCYICCPKASSAFATSASWLTGGAPLSCRFAFKYSTQYSHHTPNPRPPLPRNRPRFGSVPNVAVPWRSSRDLRLPSSNSVLHPFSPEPPHETTNPSPLCRCASPPAGVLRSSSPKQGSPLPISAQSLAPTTRKLPPNQSCLPSCSLHDFSPMPFSSTRHH